MAALLNKEAKKRPSFEGLSLLDVQTSIRFNQRA